MCRTRNACVVNRSCSKRSRRGIYCPCEADNLSSSSDPCLRQIIVLKLVSICDVLRSLVSRSVTYFSSFRFDMIGLPQTLATLERTNVSLRVSQATARTVLNSRKIYESTRYKYKEGTLNPMIFKRRTLGVYFFPSNQRKMEYYYFR